jgi:hypothetical protein
MRMRAGAVWGAAVGAGMVGAALAGSGGGEQRAELQRRFERAWGARIAAALERAEPLPVPARPELPPDVRDGAFAYLVHLLDTDAYGAVTGAQLRQVQAAAGRRSRIPCEMIGEVRRAPGEAAGEGWVRARFTGPLDVPIPYSILGYHPGSLVSSQEVVAREWRTPRSVIRDPAGDVKPDLLVEDLTLWAFVEGEVVVDIDGWVDALMGSNLDDTYVVGLAFFRFRGAAYAMALGYNREGQPRSGALHLAEDEVRFPTPRELKATARDLRARLVRHLAQMGLPAWVAD